jgi:hypothetical protein
VSENSSAENEVLKNRSQSGADALDASALLVPDVDVVVDEQPVVLDVAPLVREALVDLTAELEQLLPARADLPRILLRYVQLRLQLGPEQGDRGPMLYFF